MTSDSPSAAFGDLHPYKDRFAAHTQIPAHGRPAEEVFAELAAMAEAENQKWNRGQVSGTFYHGGMEHYAFLNRVFSLYSHANLLQRDLCPSGTKMEGEILAMTARMLHGDAVPQHHPGEEASSSRRSSLRKRSIPPSRRRPTISTCDWYASRCEISWPMSTPCGPPSRPTPSPWPARPATTLTA
jgi:hypothetical protein